MEIKGKFYGDDAKNRAIFTARIGADGEVLEQRKIA